MNKTYFQNYMLFSGGFLVIGKMKLLVLILRFLIITWSDRMTHL